MPGSGTFRLFRDLDRPNTYLSLARWESVEAQTDWIAKPEFGEYIGRAQSHCEDFQSSTYELVVEVE
jgi:heme-degrading monooxygenase HmoA